VSDDAEAIDRLLRHFVGSPFQAHPAQHIGVAVSGGSDSMALLDLLCHWGEEEGVRVSAATVDHGLRVEAKAEAARVAAFCVARGIPHDILIWDGWNGTGNMQAEARSARFELLAEWSRIRGIDVVALGHTSDDQAETFLMRLARKSGVDGLAGMSRDITRHGIRFVRPLLRQSRLALQDYLLSSSHWGLPRKGWRRPVITWTWQRQRCRFLPGRRRVNSSKRNEAILF